MPRIPVNFHHVAKSMEKPVKSLSYNRHPFLVLRGEHGEEIHYFPADTVHNQALPTIDRSKVAHAGSVIIDPIMPYKIAALTRVSWDNPNIPAAPHDVLEDVKHHIREEVKRVKGAKEADAMGFKLMTESDGL